MPRPETTIYRSDHILGKADGELTPELYRSWGRTLGRLSCVKGCIAVGSDGRESSEVFRIALKEGFADAGVCVLDLGIVPHVATLFAVHWCGAKGAAYVSGIGTPWTFNGLRWILPESPLSPQEQCRILRHDAEQDLPPRDVERCVKGRNHSFLQDWINWHQQIWFDTPQVPLRIIVDPLHGPWAQLLRRALQVIFPAIVFEAIHDEAHPQYGGLVPNAHDPESIKQLCREVDIRHADLGIAIDGETGGFSLCDGHGVPLSVNELSWLMLQSYATAIPGEKVLHTTVLPEIFVEEIRRLGGTPILTPISSPGFVEQMRQTGAILGFDHTGRFFSRTCNGYYISFFAVCWLIDYLARQRTNVAEFRRTVPPCFATQELKTPWDEPTSIAKLLKAKWNVKPEKTINSLRFVGPNGPMTLREDHDYGLLAFQFEAKNRQMLDQMIDECISALEDTELAATLIGAFQRSGALGIGIGRAGST